MAKNAAIQQSLQEDYMRLFSCQALLQRIALFQQQLQEVTHQQHSSHQHAYQALLQLDKQPIHQQEQEKAEEQQMEDRLD